jgi:hypothetical protein
VCWLGGMSECFYVRLGSDRRPCEYARACQHAAAVTPAVPAAPAQTQQWQAWQHTNLPETLQMHLTWYVCRDMATCACQKVPVGADVSLSQTSSTHPEGHAGLPPAWNGY